MAYTLGDTITVRHESGRTVTGYVVSAAPLIVRLGDGSEIRPAVRRRRRVRRAARGPAVLAA